MLADLFCLGGGGDRKRLLLELRKVQSKNHRYYVFCSVGHLIQSGYKKSSLAVQKYFLLSKGPKSYKIKKRIGGNVEESKTIKGTVRPDWICMRVVSLESPLKAHQPL